MRANRHNPRRDRRTGFTLIELVVVIGIIILLIGIAAPAVGPALSSNHQTQLIQTLSNAITIAQTRAENRGGYALRIERAFKVDARGFMVDRDGNSAVKPDGTYNAAFSTARAPVWLDHQQIRFLNPPKDLEAYTPAGDEVIALPRSAWLAPDHVFDGAFDQLHLAADPKLYPASPPGSQQSNPFDTFCIVFDQRGNVMQLRSDVWGDNYRYLDQTQMTSAGVPFTAYPYYSVRGVIVYDRSKFERSPTADMRANYLAREGRPFYINRFLGTLVEGRNQ